MPSNPWRAGSGSIAGIAHSTTAPLRADATQVGQLHLRQPDVDHRHFVLGRDLRHHLRLAPPGGPQSITGV